MRRIKEQGEILQNGDVRTMTVPITDAKRVTNRPTFIGRLLL